MTEPFDLLTTYLHLDAQAATTLVAVGDGFWEHIPPIFGHGRMVALFQNDADWTSWERHPAGDEVVYLLSGAIDLTLDEPGGARPDDFRVVSLRARTGVVVPRGVWHTATVHEPGPMLHITPGAGTEVRAR